METRDDGCGTTGVGRRVWETNNQCPLHHARVRFGRQMPGSGNPPAALAQQFPIPICVWIEYLGKRYILA
ncbi:MAG: hypothetical protein ACHBN1_07980 [Heteroscytonema crispum UTEX LB 1556]